MASSRVSSSRIWSRLSPLFRPSTPPDSRRLRPSAPFDPRRLRPFPIPPPPPNSPAAILLRHLSTAARRNPTRRVDIGARARQLHKRRLWTYALTFSCFAGFIVIVLSNFQDQLVFYVTPTVAMERFASGPTEKKNFRLGGLVLDGSFVEPSELTPQMEFVITDLDTDILVRYEGNLPDLFREGHSAVAEGFLRPLDESIRSTRGSVVSEKAMNMPCYFHAREVLAKHDEKYMPKEVAEAIERNKKRIEEEARAEAADKAS